MALSLSEIEVHKMRDDLAERLVAASEEKTAKWFNSYLKGAITYRGVKSPKIREIVKEWGPLPDSSRDQLRLVEALMAQPFAEDKFAAIFVLQDLVNDRDEGEGDEMLLDTIESCFERGDLYDWSTTDWLCERVLDKLARRGSNAERIGSWRRSDILWKRRASIVAFRGAARSGEHQDLVTNIIDDLLPSEERFILTGVGWLLADASRGGHADFAANLFEKHFDDLSLEVIQRHTKHLPKTKAQNMLKRKKATSSTTPNGRKKKKL